MSITVAALQANDGTKIWQSSVMTFPMDDSAAIQMTVASSAIYITVSMNDVGVKGQVAALGAQNGSILWKEPLDRESAGPPIAANGNVYLEVDGKTVQSLDGKSGKLLWSISRDENADDLYLRGRGPGVDTPYGSKKPLSEQIYVLSQSDGSQLSHYAVEKDPTRVIIVSIALAL
jgi:outer membrane protein assembly factor BamB